MTALTIYSDDASNKDVTQTEFETIASILKDVGVQFERWEANQPLSLDADQDEVLAAYKESIDSKSDFSAVVNEKPGIEIVDEVRFMVQVATSSTQKDSSSEFFKGLRDINELVTGKYYKYTSGSFGSYAEAAKHRKDVQSGFPDAFVIAVKNGKIIPLQEAIEETKRN